MAKKKALVLPKKGKGDEARPRAGTAEFDRLAIADPVLDAAPSVGDAGGSMAPERTPLSPSATLAESDDEAEAREGKAARKAKNSTKPKVLARGVAIKQEAAARPVSGANLPALGDDIGGSCE